MTTSNIRALYDDLNKLVEAGDEKAVRSFLIEHINDFPEEIKKKIVFEFFDEAVSKEVESGEHKATLQKEGMDTLKDIDKAEKTLEDQRKMADVRSELGK